VHIFVIFNIFQGHQYEVKEKALALTLYKMMGKRGYNYLRNVFKHIPSILTLQLALQKIPVSPGLNPLIARHLENISQKMSIKDKVYILMWDERSIQSNIMYDVQKDIIYGEDWDNNRTSKVADHALVFMLRGLNTGRCPYLITFAQKQQIQLN